MGNYFIKQNQDKEMLSSVVIDKQRELDVYINVYANTSEQLIGGEISGNSIGTNAGHYSLLIDIFGESNDDEHPVGLEAHLVMVQPSTSKVTQYKVSERLINSNKLQSTTKIGKALKLNENDKDINDIEITTRIFIRDLFKKFIDEKCNGDLNWSRKNNCHQFAKYCVSALELQWPQSIASPIEEYPFLVDFWSLKYDATIITNKTS